jgi:hypothetical protein
MQGKLRADAKLADLRNANAAVIQVDASASDVEATLRKVAGVVAVEAMPSGDEGGAWKRYRVSSTSDRELVPAIYEKVRETKWKVGELRPDPKTLERVFRDLADNPNAEVRS